MTSLRRPAAVLTALLTVPAIAACGGGPDALDDAAAEKALLSQDDFPLDGFTRGEVTTGVQKATDFDPSTLPDTDETCHKALEDFSAVKPEEYLSSSASARFEDGKDKSVDLQVSGTSKEPEKLIEITRALGECKEVKSSGGGVDLTTSFEEFENDDVRGVRVRSEAGGQTQEIWMGGRTAGDNVVYATATGVSEDDLAKVVNEQVSTIED